MSSMALRPNFSQARQKALYSRRVQLLKPSDSSRSRSAREERHGGRNGHNQMALCVKLLNPLPRQELLVHCSQGGH